MFGEMLLSPDKGRDPAYDSGNKNTDPNYRFRCDCGDSIILDLPSYIGNYQDQNAVLGPENGEAVRAKFGLRHDKSLVDGWPKFRIEKCPKCRKKYLVYIAVHEPANGWYQIVPQGIVELVPSNK